MPTPLTSRRPTKRSSSQTPKKFKGLKGAEGTLKTVAPKKDAATLVEEADTKAQKLKAAKAEAEIKANENATDADAAAEQKADEKVEFADAEESAPEAV